MVQHFGRDGRLIMSETAFFKPAHHGRHVHCSFLASEVRG
jgi:hypothetical protein